MSAALAASRRTRAWRGLSLATYGVLGTFAACFILFAILRTSAFLTGSNLAGISNVAAIDALLAAGITVPLIMKDFDLSIGSAASLSSAVSIVLLSNDGWPVAGAIALALGVGAAVGLLNGLIVAVLGASSFIATLAMGSVLTGLEYLLTNQRTIVGNVPDAFLTIGSASVGGVILPVFIVVVVVAIIAAMLTQTALGRYVQAVGSNADASRIVGLPVTRLRVLGFLVSGVCAALAGIFISAIAGNSFPNAGSGHLLPAFAAAFLGATLFPARRFSAVGAAVAAWLLEMVATGLVELNLASWTINVFNGAVLIAAILTALRSLNRT